jgi:hypothetical protein
VAAVAAAAIVGLGDVTRVAGIAAWALAVGNA